MSGQKETLQALIFHPLADVFPLLEGKPFAELKEDIRANGLREPIWVYEDSIIDGRNRFRACQELGILAPTREWPGKPEDLAATVLSWNLHRRHLSSSQRAVVASKMATLADGERKRKAGAQICAAALGQTEAAALLNVSRRLVQQVRKVNETGAPELFAALERGEITASAAAEITTLPKSRQRAVVAGGKAAINRAVRAVKRARPTRTKAPRYDSYEATKERYKCQDDESDMTDEEWLTSLPQWESLDKAQQQTFRLSALVWRTLQFPLQTFRDDVKRAITDANDGELANRARDMVAVTHPREWTLNNGQLKVTK